MVITDRYVGSNLAHQTARMTRAFRKDFLAWLKELEYQVYGMPAEDLVIYLRSPVELAHRLAGSRRDREYTKMDRDLAESDLKHLEAASEAYDYLALQPNWLRIECYDGVERHLHTPKEIHDQVIAAVEKRILSALEASA
jgi:dTMP kinase